MTLYESNYIRLGWLAPDLGRLAGRVTSEVGRDLPLELAVLDRSRYTTTLGLTYLLDGVREQPERAPDLAVRVYHDARLAEACGPMPEPGPSGLRLLAGGLPRGSSERWNWNMLLNKWLEYCVGCGHRFPQAAT